MKKSPIFIVIIFAIVSMLFVLFGNKFDSESRYNNEVANFKN